MENSAEEMMEKIEGYLNLPKSKEACLISEISDQIGSNYILIKLFLPIVKKRTEELDINNIKLIRAEIQRTLLEIISGDIVLTEI